MHFVISVQTRFAKTVPVSGLPCPLCRHQGRVEMSLYQMCLKAFGIPTMPGRKFGAAYCNQCAQPIPFDADKPALKAAFRQVAGSVSPPLSSYAGSVLMLLLVAGVAGWVAMQIRHNRQVVQAEIVTLQAASDPRAGDVYLATLNTNSTLTYTMFKVQSVAGDQVTLRTHRDTQPYLSKQPQASDFDLADRAFNGASVVANKSDLAKRTIFLGKFDTATIEEVIRSPQP